LFKIVFDFLQNGLITHIEFPTWLNPMLVIIAMYIFCAVVGYLLGSINSAVLVSRLLYRQDIRKQGSGNAGLTNMMRVYGKKAAGLVLLGDVLKTVLSVAIAGFIAGFQYSFGFVLNPVLYIAAVACMLGHVYPVYFRFKGGKGVLCIAAAALVLSPIVFAVDIFMFIMMLLFTKYVSLASITAGFLYPLLLRGCWAMVGGKRLDGVIMLSAIFIALFILYCHRSNIRRLLDHTENKFSFKKKDKNQEHKEDTK